MKDCPTCGGKSSVIESREMVYQGILTFRRRRRCDKVTCRTGWSTVEIRYEPIARKLNVEKRNTAQHS